MKMQMYLLNRTYIAEDRSTGLVAYAQTEQLAQSKLATMVQEYWQDKKIVVPINKEPKKDEHGA